MEDILDSVKSSCSISLEEKAWVCGWNSWRHYQPLWSTGTKHEQLTRILNAVTQEVRGLKAKPALICMCVLQNTFSNVCLGEFSENQTENMDHTTGLCGDTLNLSSSPVSTTSPSGSWLKSDLQKMWPRGWRCCLPVVSSEGRSQSDAWISFGQAGGGVHTATAVGARVEGENSGLIILWHTDKHTHTQYKHGGGGCLKSHVVRGWWEYQDVPCGSVRWGLAEAGYFFVSIRAGVIQRQVVLVLILTAHKKGSFHKSHTEPEPQKLQESKAKKTL